MNDMVRNNFKIASTDNVKMKSSSNQSQTSKQGKETKKHMQLSLWSYFNPKPKV